MLKINKYFLHVGNISCMLKINKYFLHVGNISCLLGVVLACGVFLARYGNFLHVKNKDKEISCMLKIKKRNLPYSISKSFPSNKPCTKKHFLHVKDISYILKALLTNLKYIPYNIEKKLSLQYT